MLKIILTKGLPASGKSTWAKNFIAQRTTDYGERWKRINKDDLRLMMDNSVWSKSNESFVKKVRDEIVRMALKDKTNVIVDDTNLDDSHINRMKQIADEFLIPVDDSHGISMNPTVIVEEKDFTNVPLETCIERDKKRSASVGEKVIRHFYNQYLKKEPKKAEFIEGVPNAVICDIDGTIAIKGDRDIYDYTKICIDTVNDAVKLALMAMEETWEPSIIFCSGRDDNCRVETEKWLTDNNIPWDKLLMRKTGDKRKDSIVKQEIYDAEIKGKYNIMAIFDDRNCVVEMWRNNGLPVFQVADGDF